jgi:hypothetical protein
VDFMATILVGEEQARDWHEEKDSRSAIAPRQDAVDRHVCRRQEGIEALDLDLGLDEQVDRRLKKLLGLLVDWPQRDQYSKVVKMEAMDVFYAKYTTGTVDHGAGACTDRKFCHTISQMSLSNLRAQ